MVVEVIRAEPAFGEESCRAVIDALRCEFDLSDADVARLLDTSGKIERASSAPRFARE
jgi:hypothetical protein